MTSSELACLEHFRTTIYTEFFSKCAASQDLFKQPGTQLDFVKPCLANRCGHCNMRGLSMKWIGFLESQVVRSNVQITDDADVVTLFAPKKFVKAKKWPFAQVSNKASLHCRPSASIFLWHVQQAQRRIFPCDSALSHAELCRAMEPPFECSWRYGFWELDLGVAFPLLQTRELVNTIQVALPGPCVIHFNLS